MTIHLNLVTIDQYILGKLTEEEIEQVELHLLLCQACRDEVDLVDEITQALREEDVLCERGRVGAAVGD